MKLTIIVSILSCFLSHAQDNVQFEELITQAKHTYEQIDSYQVTTSYDIFKFSQSENITPIESYSGLYAYNKNEVYSKIGPIEIISSHGKLVQVNHELKEIMYTEIEQEEMVSNPLEISQFASVFTKVIVTKTAKGWSCDLSVPTDINAIPYAQIVIEFDNNHFVTKQRLYPLKIINFKAADNGSTADRAVIQIEFSVPKALGEKNLFNMENFVVKRGSDIKQANSLKDYELIKT